MHPPEFRIYLREATDRRLEGRLLRLTRELYPHARVILDRKALFTRATFIRLESLRIHPVHRRCYAIPGTDYEREAIEMELIRALASHRA